MNPASSSSMSLVALDEYDAADTIGEIPVFDRGAFAEASDDRVPEHDLDIYAGAGSDWYPPDLGGES